MGKNNKRRPRKYNPDGSENEDYVNVLHEDPPIAGQNWACFSFLSPEKELKQKDIFMFSEFLRSWDVNKPMNRFNGFLQFICHKYNIKTDEVVKDFQDFVEEEKKELTTYSTLKDDFELFQEQNKEALEAKFEKEAGFTTPYRGVMFRGAFDTLEEAQLRAKMLNKTDKYFNILAGPVGKWLPWDPTSTQVEDVVYAEEELNQLMHEKINNANAAQSSFDQRVTDFKRSAIEQNKKNAEKYGYMLTQDIDEDGNLIDSEEFINRTKKNSNQFDVNESEIHTELLDPSDVVTDPSTDHGASTCSLFAPKSE